MMYAALSVAVSALLAGTGCAGAGSHDGSLTTAHLWVPSDGRFQVYRYLQSAGDTDTGTLGDDKLETQYQTGGCRDGDGWRVEMRIGDDWESAEPAGALHFLGSGETDDGLAICGYEAPGGSAVFPDPAITFWGADPIDDGEVLKSGDWKVTIAHEEDLVTYFGVFPFATSFSVAGGGAGPDGWTFHLAEDHGIVKIEGTDFTADYVYVR
jgi:hypothetical protein